MRVQGLLKKTYGMLFEMRNRYVLRKTYKAEIRNINKKEKLWSRVHLSDEQEHEIISYWEDISGEEISTKWHRLYQSYMGVYNKQYFPEILYSTKLEPMLSQGKYHGVLSDKGFLTSIFSGGGYRTPKTIVWNCDGLCINEHKTPMSTYEEEKLVEDIGTVVIKPTRDTSSGEGVRILCMKNGIDTKTNEPWSEIKKFYRENYIIQERIKQSQFLSNLYPGSLNTFRVITFIAEDSVHVAPIGMRLGRGGSEIDNIHAGGITIGVDCSYRLRKYAFAEMGERFERHPDTGVVFEDYKIPTLEKVIETAKRLHGSIPQLKMISWDWTIDENEMPVLIETNISGQSVWFPQMLIWRVYRVFCKYDQKEEIELCF